MIATRFPAAQYALAMRFGSFEQSSLLQWFCKLGGKPLPVGFHSCQFFWISNLQMKAGQGKSLRTMLQQLLVLPCGSVQLCRRLAHRITGKEVED